MNMLKDFDRMTTISQEVNRHHLEHEAAGEEPNLARDYAELLVAFNRAHAERDGLPPVGYRGAPEFLLKHGRVFEPFTGPMPKGLWKGVPKQCYYTCFMAAKRKGVSGRFAYAEGYAVPVGCIPVAHAWLVDRETGQAVELTLGSPAAAYFGSTFKIAALVKALAMNEEYSMLFSWTGSHFCQLMDGEIKAEDILGGSDMNATAIVYSTKEVVELTGITLRQAQWWDEKGLVSADIKGHHRAWSSNQVLLLLLIQALRGKGLSLATIKKLIPRLKLLRSDYFIASGKNSVWLESEAEVIAWFKRESRGAVLLYLPDYHKQLGGGNSCR